MPHNCYTGWSIRLFVSVIMLLCGGTYTNILTGEDVPQAPKKYKYNDIEVFQSAVEPLTHLSNRRWLLDSLLYNMQLTCENIKRLHNWLAIIQHQADYKDPYGEVSSLAEQLSNIIESASLLIAYRNTLQHLEPASLDSNTIYLYLRQFLITENITPIDAAEWAGYIKHTLGSKYTPYPGFSDRAMQLLPHIQRIDALPGDIESFNSLYEQHIMERARTSFANTFITHIASRRNGSRLSQPTPQSHYINSNLSPEAVYEAMEHGLKSALYAMKKTVSIQGESLGATDINQMAYNFLITQLSNKLNNIAQCYNIAGSTTMELTHNIQRHFIQYLESSRRLFEEALEILSRQPEGAYQSLIAANESVTTRPTIPYHITQVTIDNVPEVPEYSPHSENIDSALEHLEPIPKFRLY